MLKFKNKQGIEVMEIHDNGDMKILNEELKVTFAAPKDKEAEKKEDGQND